MEILTIISLVMWAFLFHAIAWDLICKNTGARVWLCVCFSVFGFIASILLDIRNLLINNLSSGESDEPQPIGFKSLDDENR